MEENQGFKPDPGNLAVRHYRGATGIVSHGGNVNPSCNRKSRNGNPPPKSERARALSRPIYFVVWFYNQRGGAENLIKEANNDAGLTAHPSRRFDVNGNHFQLAMLAYNLNCWLMLFNREPQADADELRHTTLATARLRFLFVAAKIWRHAGRTGVSYSDQYQEQGVFERLMTRLRRIVPRAQGYGPVMVPALC